MASPTSGIIGVDVTAAPDTTPQFTPGTETPMSDGTRWKYLACKISTVIGQYMACGVSATNAAEPITSTIGLRGVMVAIAQQAVASNAALQYMWFLIANPFASTTYKVKVAASAAIDAKLATTAFAGTLDDTTAGTVMRVNGIVLTDSQPSGSSGSRTFRTSNYPLTWDAV